MLILYIALGAFLIGGGIVATENLSTQKERRTYR